MSECYAVIVGRGNGRLSVIQAGPGSQVNIGQSTQLTPEKRSHIQTVHCAGTGCVSTARTLGSRQAGVDAVEDIRVQVKADARGDPVRITGSGGSRVGRALRSRTALIVVSVIARQGENNQMPIG